MAEFTERDPATLGFAEAIQAMAEAAVQQHYWDSVGDGAGERGFHQQAAWRKRAQAIRERLDVLWGGKS